MVQRGTFDGQGALDILTGDRFESFALSYRAHGGAVEAAAELNAAARQVFETRPGGRSDDRAHAPDPDIQAMLDAVAVQLRTR